MKAIFFDIDGTLWDEKMEIPSSTAEAIRELKKNGHKTFICSGRARGNILSPKLLELGFDGIVAACGNYVEMDGKVLHNALLSAELLKKTIALLKQYKMPVVLEGPDDHWMNDKGFEEDPYVDYLFQTLGESAHILNGYEEKMAVNKLSGLIRKDTDYEKIQEVLSGDFTLLEHEEEVVEFVPKGTSKATGIEWVCRYLGINRMDTYAIGDSVNDLDMLSYVGHGIAMGNATEEVKQTAEFVTTEIHEDGIYHAMKHYGLIL